MGAVGYTEVNENVQSWILHGYLVINHCHLEFVPHTLEIIFIFSLGFNFYSVPRGSSFTQ